MVSHYPHLCIVISAPLRAAILTFGLDGRAEIVEATPEVDWVGRTEVCILLVSVEQDHSIAFC
jgi:hypothetical protein